ncbi:probable ADP-ribosylation factor GTPase-activating protein AGD14 isoform X2 [Lathyrus oleraceus]|uniref:probable ADP-ribosylation factor GTPase-activating protein AGD14 isoform X2 n=1 Tax=Pisum sativum TaxID=3888 RepID=UPI0021D23738|nr:probable ADP-ribosylation factor GTPase-activating protein AGD14 isoform X2 [Pisum sativum]
MASRLREDEKQEHAIRALLRLEPNQRCINCNSLGPQYVCTNFWTFVCTACSGIHREFTHRVKSVSMAKFTSQEVTALQEGGNQRARKVYFREWDAQHHSFPDSELRDFIKHVYVDRRFTGDSTSDKPPRVKNSGDKDGSYENRRVEAYQGGSKSPPYEDSHERRYSDRSSPGGRSPGYDQESRQVGDYKRSPGCPPVINDWRREDRRISDGGYKTERHSPAQARNLGSSSPSVGPSVREILGENVVPLRISGPPKPNNGKAADASALTQKTAFSGSLVSSNESQVNIKLETTKSLIDFDADPEPIAPTIPQAQQTSAPQPVSGNSSDDNWASFDIASEAKANQSNSNLNPLESILSQLSYSASLSSHASGVQGPIPAGALSFGSLSAFPSNGALMPSSGQEVVLPHDSVGQWASSQHQQPMFSAVNSQPSHVPSVPTGQGYPNTQMPHAYHHASKPANEAFNSILSQPSAVEAKPSGRTELSEDLFIRKLSSFSAPVQEGWQAGLPQGTGNSMQYNNNVVPIPSFSEPSRSTNPFDVSSKQTPDQDQSFLSISSLHGALPSVSPSLPMHPPYQSNPLHGWSPPLPNVGTMYSNVGTMYSSSLGLQPHAWNPPLPNIPSSGTMHFSSLGLQPHAWNPPLPNIPSSGTMHSSSLGLQPHAWNPPLPNIPSSGTLHPSSLGNPSHAWNPTLSSPYASFLPPQAPIHASALGLGSNNGQQMPPNTPMPRQEDGNFGAERDIFGLSNPDQQLTGKPSITPTSNPFPKRGNPFG